MRICFFSPLRYPHLGIFHDLEIKAKYLEIQALSVKYLFGLLTLRWLGSITRVPIEDARLRVPGSLDACYSVRMGS